ncbi:hypothetical protein LBK6_14240 [Leptospira borgpetersenii serovar Hardjo]|nr:hypothetical protein LBK6_14240 [Leptospira borgpetersenii serovar Hardjo]AMX62664.1 hypothetical protein LBK9_14160 [Leptospira borgpetersenii serovar Hardjo]AMX65907.1 hypothetical protein LBK30_14170 [Leptospira borgpetersenii serovar Hardjo]AMX69140.1 hypothetical protein LBHA_14125 [Leptospira borgpetersenii serovar Hardjo]AMX70197.1 hypothetical protein LBHB_02315 [Leptospira borgpetersenii serovar Hardjo]
MSTYAPISEIISAVFFHFRTIYRKSSVFRIRNTKTVIGIEPCFLNVGDFFSNVSSAIDNEVNVMIIPQMNRLSKIVKK